MSNMDTRIVPGALSLLLKTWLQSEPWKGSNLFPEASGYPFNLLVLNRLWNVVRQNLNPSLQEEQQPNLSISSKSKSFFQECVLFLNEWEWMGLPDNFPSFKTDNLVSDLASMNLNKGDIWKEQDPKRKGSSAPESLAMSYVLGLGTTIRTRISLLGFIHLTLSLGTQYVFRYKWHEETIRFIKTAWSLRVIWILKGQMAMTKTHTF